MNGVYYDFLLEITSQCEQTTGLKSLQTAAKKHQSNIKLHLH